MKQVISYLINFLIGGEQAHTLSSLVGYTNDPRQFDKYQLVIIPSPFFKEGIYGTDRSMPQLPLKEIEGIPLLFGTKQIEWVGDTLVVHADLIASAYFLLTRYEEIRRRDVRDQHGRFPGKESLPYRAGFIHRPIVDEYGVLLRRWLRQLQIPIPEEQEPRISKVRLTHDVDAPFYCRTLRNLLRETVRGKGFLHALHLYQSPINEDPFYTFPWLLDKGVELQQQIGKERCKTTIFLKAGGRNCFDRPFYSLHSNDIQELIHACQSRGCHIGLHSSYTAGKEPKLIQQEKESLEHILGRRITENRHHYLTSREPEDLNWLEKTGIKDDYTMGYADVAGFRLGTARPVLWINPETRRLSLLHLHPLTIMDGSLSEPNYMHLNYKGALAYAQKLINATAAVHGELTLLWHNDSVPTKVHANLSVNWQRQLYASLIEILKKA